MQKYGLKQRFLIGIFILFTLLNISSCKNLFEKSFLARENLVDMETGNKGVLQLNIGNGNTSRAAFPSSVFNVANYVVTLTKLEDGATPQTLSPIPGNNLSFLYSIPTVTATYKLEITASVLNNNSVQEPILKKSMNIEIKAATRLLEVSVPLTFFAESGSSKKGKIHFKIKNYGLASYFTIRNLENNDAPYCTLNSENEFEYASTPQFFRIVEGTPSSLDVGALSFSPGNYSLRFEFYKGPAGTGSPSQNASLYEFIGNYDSQMAIFSGLTTDTWYDSNGNAITDNLDLQDTFSKTYYVRGTSGSFYSKSGSGIGEAALAKVKVADDKNEGGIFSPLATLQEAVNRIVTINSNSVSVRPKYIIYVDGEIKAPDPTGTSVPSNGAFVSINSATYDLDLTIKSLSQGSKAKINANSTNSSTNRAMRVFHISGKVSVKFENITITGGNASDNGGGIFVGSGTVNLTLENVNISGNTAKKAGGGIYLSSGQLTVTNSNIGYSGATPLTAPYGSLTRQNLTSTSGNLVTDTANVSNLFGGGLYLESGATATLENTNIIGNFVSHTLKQCFGGGVFSLGTLTARNCKIDYNHLKTGGAQLHGAGLCIGNTDATNGIKLSTFDGCTISNNKATNSYNINGIGIAIYSKDASNTYKVSLLNSVIKNNSYDSTNVSSSANGDGIYLSSSGQLTLGGTTVIGTYSGSTLTDNNDVWIPSNSINIENLSGNSPVATITRSSYTLGSEILKPSSGVFLSDNDCSRFIISPKDGIKYRIFNNGDKGILVIQNILPSGAQQVDLFTAMTNADANTLIELTSDITISSRGPEVFRGILDGKGHTITLSSSSVNLMLFSNIGNFLGEGSEYWYGYALLCGTNSGTIKNLKLKGSITYAGEWVQIGSVAVVNSGSIINCINNVKFNDNNQSYETRRDIGGICSNNTGTIENCANISPLTGSAEGDDEKFLNWVGGIAGRNSGKIANCVNYGYLTGNCSDDSYGMPGPIVGYTSGGSISNCYWKNGLIMKPAGNNQASDAYPYYYWNASVNGNRGGSFSNNAKFTTNLPNATLLNTWIDNQTLPVYARWEEQVMNGVTYVLPKITN